MNGLLQSQSLCPAFECFRLDSSAYPDSFPVPLHNHYFSELLLVREGNCVIIRDGVTHQISAGGAVYISPLIPHSVDSADGGPVVLDLVKFSATRMKEIPDYLADFRAISLDAARLHLPIQMSPEEVQSLHLDNIIRECLVENERKRFAYDLRIRAMIYWIITALARFWLEKRESFPNAGSVRKDPVLSLPAYIEEHIAEPLKVEDLAAMLGISYPWFAKRFRDFFGVSCKQFIEQVRMDYVEQYLIHSNLDLEEISRRTGFTDSSHMVKSFRQLRNMTPGQFRALARTDGHPPFYPVSRLRAPKYSPKG